MGARAKVGRVGQLLPHPILAHLLIGKEVTNLGRPDAAEAHFFVRSVCNKAAGGLSESVKSGSKGGICLLTVDTALVSTSATTRDGLTEAEHQRPMQGLLNCARKGLQRQVIPKMKMFSGSELHISAAEIHSVGRPSHNFSRKRCGGMPLRR